MVDTLLAAVLHFVPDSDEPLALVETYRDAVVPGSHLVVSHLTGSHDPGAMRILAQRYAETSDPIHPRETGWIEELFGDFEILPPGAAYLADWRPEPGQVGTDRDYHLLYGGVARKH
ncbi:SAM-dependent methyltransferase [Saccharopolyspora sp. K220]|uniref:SAM-dependent methyltransferase n=1 Tax=Saccharopolyspora soli TaxID=2926618 RepID=UPI001F55F23C|nr:SAM-dependent methyltransferase [Saccharopolyspora soli]MCI2418303.1 SAM-dependent methyltransferase [Saccharopolyspora soli]